MCCIDAGKASTPRWQDRKERNAEVRDDATQSRPKNDRGKRVTGAVSPSGELSTLPVMNPFPLFFLPPICIYRTSTRAFHLLACRCARFCQIAIFKFLLFFPILWKTSSATLPKKKNTHTSITWHSYCPLGPYWRFETIYIQGVPVLVCQTKLGDRDHRSKKILSKDPCPEMNRLASRRM